MWWPAGPLRPPFGLTLGQDRFNLMAFCQEPRTRCEDSEVRSEDNTFEFAIKSPSGTRSLKKVAGIESGDNRPGHVVVLSTMLRHVREIAKVNQSDPFCEDLSIEAICKSIIGTPNSMGIEVVKRSLIAVLMTLHLLHMIKMK